jgi:hypothetical protein
MELIFVRKNSLDIHCPYKKHLRTFILDVGSVSIFRQKDKECILKGTLKETTA